ncbi:hypothetical protein K402DRAFT_138251 [Aulographum hederae CBS 113979]|uniref:Uncharacterized protein n=1 Tax=Aulographum hederae CBS 113979 TaxID=1176131 RepID=A0A6G1GUE0_9PEZI|nr:hypothetical protein K402DRAFT_138251 [Aulographum hederae CBS 113979]
MRRLEAPRPSETDDARLAPLGHLGSRGYSMVETPWHNVSLGINTSVASSSRCLSCAVDSKHLTAPRRLRHQSLYVRVGSLPDQIEHKFITKVVNYCCQPSVRAYEEALVRPINSTSKGWETQQAKMPWYAIRISRSHLVGPRSQSRIPTLRLPSNLGVACHLICSIPW